MLMVMECNRQVMPISVFHHTIHASQLFFVKLRKNKFLYISHISFLHMKDDNKKCQHHLI